MFSMVVISFLKLRYCLYGEIKYGETALTDERIQAVFHSLDELDAGLTCTDPRIRWQMVNQIIVRNWHYVKPYLEFCEERSISVQRNPSPAR